MIRDWPLPERDGHTHPHPGGFLCARSSFKEFVFKFGVKHAFSKSRKPQILRNQLGNEQTCFDYAGVTRSSVGPSRETNTSEEQTTCKPTHLLGQCFRNSFSKDVFNMCKKLHFPITITFIQLSQTNSSKTTDFFGKCRGQRGETILGGRALAPCPESYMRPGRCGIFKTL